MEGTIIRALIAHAQGHIAKHKANVNMLLVSPMGIADHPNIIETIEGELEQISKYHDQIEMLRIYFE